MFGSKIRAKVAYLAEPHSKAEDWNPRSKETPRGGYESEHEIFRSQEFPSPSLAQRKELGCRVKLFFSIVDLTTFLSEPLSRFETFMKQDRSKIWAVVRVMTTEKQKVWYL